LTGRGPYNPRVVFIRSPGSSIGAGVMGTAHTARDSTDPEGGPAKPGNSRLTGYGRTYKGMGRDTTRTTTHRNRTHTNCLNSADVDQCIRNNFGRQEK